MIAVLDWELSTLGHPLVDIAHLCMMYLTIPNSPAVQEMPGAPSEEILTKWYAEGTSNSHPLPNWPFFKALVCFRVAAIAQVRLK